jgi:hypothetical protein
MLGKRLFKPNSGVRRAQPRKMHTQFLKGQYVKDEGSVDRKTTHNIENLEK